MTPLSKIGPSSPLGCAQCEEYLADLLDGVLTANLKTRVESHLAGCVACAEFARDVAGAMALAERTAAVEVPATLVPQILAEITTGPSRVLVQTPVAERIFGHRIRPVLQPRFALGFAMAMLSLAVIPWRTVVSGKQVVDLSVASTKILTLAENRVVRVYDRAIKGYEDSTVVAEASKQFDDWRGTDEQNSSAPAPSDTPDRNAGGQLR